MWLDGALAAETDQAGFFGAHAGGRSFLGVLFVHLPFPGEAFNADGATPIETRGGTGFHGGIRRLLLYNRALPPAEITSLHSNPIQN